MRPGLLLAFGYLPAREAETIIMDYNKGGNWEGGAQLFAPRVDEMLRFLASYRLQLNHMLSTCFLPC